MEFSVFKALSSTLRSQHSLADIEESLDKLPKNLPDIYAKMLSKLRSQDPDDARVAFRILAFLTHADQSFSLLACSISCPFKLEKCSLISNVCQMMISFYQ